MSKNAWVDYKEIKEKVSMQMVLDRYGVLEKLRPSGKDLVGCCPIHKGSNSRQFSVNLEKNAFNCFGDCKGGGNVLDFVAGMEKVSVREAALLLKDWFFKEASPAPRQARKKKNNQPARKEDAPRKSEKPKPASEDPTVINPPLRFELKNLEPQHAFFEERGLDLETIKHFGLGYCSRGMMAGRIAIPIHNEKGELVAYCGRAVSAEQIEEEGKYKMPANFKKLHVVYNLNRQEAGAKKLALFESFLSVHRFYQAGIANTAALMGSVLGPEQEELLVSFLGPDGMLMLMFDADEDGEKCTDDCLKRLGRRLYVRAVDIGEYARKPHQLDLETIQKILPR